MLLNLILFIVEICLLCFGAYAVAAPVPGDGTTNHQPPEGDAP